MNQQGNVDSLSQGNADGVGQLGIGSAATADDDEWPQRAAEVHKGPSDTVS